MTRKLNINGKIASLTLAMTEEANQRYENFSKCRVQFFARKLNAFTLAEVLITLVIIGVIAAITVGIIYNNSKWAQYRSGLMKAQSTLNQLSIWWHTEKGRAVECGYWRKNPYSNNSCTAQCSQYSDEGKCIKYTCKETGGSLPSDYNGSFTDCRALYDFYKERLSIQKICESNAYENGCIPKYQGNDSAHKLNNPGASDVDANIATSGCPGFNQAQILAGKAIVLTDGTIFFPYSGYVSGIMGVDVNGFKGPNKWGHDVHAFMPRHINAGSDPTFYPGGCFFKENGGKNTYDIMYKNIL